MEKKKSSGLLLSLPLSLFLFSLCECVRIYLWCLFSRSICFCTLSWLSVCKSLCTGMPWLSMCQCAVLTIIRRHTAVCLPKLSDASLVHFNIFVFFEVCAHLCKEAKIDLKTHQSLTSIKCVAEREREREREIKEVKCILVQVCVCAQPHALFSANLSS